MDRTTATDGADRGDAQTLGRARPLSAEFEAFVRRHSARLVGSLALITLDHGLAEDAAQEAFFQLYLHWSEVRDPVAWLYRVGLNRCKNYRRTLSRTARLVERLGRTTPKRTIEPWSPETEFVAFVRPLPERQRAAVALSYLADLSTAEIAQIMEISQGTVGAHLHKAREALRESLEVE
jgi:RNA polymerase sigma factor (sigma-70 family)